VTPLERLLARLRSLEFDVEERTELFGEPLPNLRAVATDSWARQLVLVAEEPPPEIDTGEAVDHAERWRDLIFAVSGLRHHLRGSGRPALSPPVLLALAGDEGTAVLRSLVEEIAGEYALFSRLDLNIVNRTATERDDCLDEALTSLLPRVRGALRDEVTVATQDVERFWEELSQEIEQTAEELEGEFGGETTANSVREVKQVLRSGSRGATSEADTGVAPISRLEIDDFRSFGRAEFAVPAVGIVYGSNGAGKTSLCEAMEILWSGRSSRIPEGVKAHTYERHLKREGRPFRLRCYFEEGGEPSDVTEIRNGPSASLGRTVLPQHSVDEMAGSSPQERFRAFLSASGLELPDFEERVADARRKMFEDANVALGLVDIERIRAVNANALNHLRAQLEAGFAAELPSDAELEGAAEALATVTDGAYQAKPIPGFDPAELRAKVEAADAALGQVRAELDRAPDPSPAAEAAAEALGRESERLAAGAAPLRQLLDHLRTRELDRGVQAESAPSSFSPVPPRPAAHWLAHVRGVEHSIPDLEQSLGEIDDKAWRDRLQAYIDALHVALDASSAEELEKLVAAGDEAPAALSRPLAPPPPALLEAAGFIREPVASEAVSAALEYLYQRRVGYAAALSRLAAALSRHPGPFFSARAARIMPALCDFELSREVAKPTGAVTRARETLVGRLLDDRLKPVVQELVSALVRFEWYFDEPLEVAVKGREMRMWGLSAGDPELDIRMLLNEAERSVVGIAWFLALHILQPKPCRQVLLLDDPASGFDETNKAAFVATLRSLLHMLKPEQFLITTHDDAVVALLEQELGEVGGWPPEMAVLRCSRRSDGSSEVLPGRSDSLGKADLERELRMLSLQGEGLRTTPTEGS